MAVTQEVWEWPCSWDKSIDCNYTKFLNREDHVADLCLQNHCVEATSAFTSGERLWIESWHQWAHQWLLDFTAFTGIPVAAGITLPGCWFPNLEGQPLAWREQALGAVQRPPCRGAAGQAQPCWCPQDGDGWKKLSGGSVYISLQLAQDSLG